jgi:hypothetical protein
MDRQAQLPTNRRGCTRAVLIALDLHGATISPETRHGADKDLAIMTNGSAMGTSAKGFRHARHAFSNALVAIVRPAFPSQLRAGLSGRLRPRLLRAELLPV